MACEQFYGGTPNFKILRHNHIEIQISKIMKQKRVKEMFS